MVSGLPDWRLALNITGQESGYLTTRPSYGGAEASFNQLVISPTLGNKLIVSISGRGVIYGGYCFSSCPSNHTTDYLYADIDGFNVLSDRANAMNGMKVNNNNMGFFWLEQYDPVLFAYTWGIGKNITFETQFDLYHANRHGDDATLNYHILYALVS